jgi:hypothetical protein
MDNPIRFVDPDGMDASDYGYGGSNVGAYDVTSGTLWSKNGETMWDGGGGGGDKGKNKKNGGTKEKDTKPKLTGLDASAAAAKSPNAADKVSTPPLIDPATLQKLKSGLQVMGYNGESGDGKDALDVPFDPNKYTIYLDKDAMLAIDAAHGFGDRIPDIEDLTLNTGLLGDKVTVSGYTSTTSGSEGSVATLDHSTSNIKPDGGSITIPTPFQFGLGSSVTFGYSTDGSLFAGFGTNGIEGHLSAGFGVGLGQVGVGGSHITEKGQASGGDITFRPGAAALVMAFVNPFAFAF